MGLGLILYVFTYYFISYTILANLYLNIPNHRKILYYVYLYYIFINNKYIKIKLGFVHEIF